MNALPIFLSYDPSDATTATDLKKYLSQAFEGTELLFWDQEAVSEEQYRKQARDFIEKSALFIACFSANYQDTPTVRWELDLAVQEQKRRRGLQIMVVLARGAVLPEILRGFPIAPGTEQPVEGFSLSRDIQLHHCVQRIWEVLVRFNREPAPVLPPRTEYTLTFEDVRERALVWAEQCDLGPVFSLLKKLLHPEKTPDDLFQLEDAFGEWRQQARRTKLSFDLFSQTMSAIRLDLRHLINLLEEAQLRHQWQDIFAQVYYALLPAEPPADTLGGIFLPASDILVPEKLNLPATARADSLETLSQQQQQEFRRNLLLAQDAVGIGQFDRAHAHCEHVRNHLDPQSAQLYELLLLTYLKKETPDRIVQDAVYGAGSKLNHVIVYAGRFAEYQRGGKCPSESGWYNLRAVAEALSNAFHRLYAGYQNDYILHTGRYGKEVPDNRTAIARCVQLAMEVYRTIHPYRGFLELVVNELCNGGKYDYIRQVEIVGDAFRFASHEDFGLESEIREVVGMLEAISPDDDDVLMNRQLRENLLFNLKAKCRRLQVQLAEERRRFVAFTDVRDSVIELVQAALLGYKIFGDEGYPPAESFLRLAVEQLLPGLLLPTAIDAGSRAAPDLRWFTLDEQGEVATHPDCEAYRFDALSIVEKITRDHAGHTGWLQVHPNIKQEVFLQFTADIDVAYEWVRHNLQWTDIRRLKDKEARRKVILCLQNWKIAYLAYPASGAPYLQRMIQELIGARLLEWLRFQPAQLGTIEESRSLGFDALNALKELLELPSGMPQEEVFKMLGYTIFHRHILPTFAGIPPGDESARQATISLLLQALHLFRDLYPAPEYLDFVFSEITEEHKFRWVDVAITGDWQPFPYESDLSFDPTDILEQLALSLPQRFKLLEARRRIARRRFSDLQNRYFREVSEYTHENRQIERQITIEVLRKLKGLFLFYPDAAFLELPIRELEGNGRIRWREQWLGVFPSRSNHYENQYFRFDYQQELSEFRMYRDTRLQWMEHVLRQTGDLAE